MKQPCAAFLSTRSHHITSSSSLCAACRAEHTRPSPAPVMLPRLMRCDVMRCVATCTNQPSSACSASSASLGKRFDKQTCRRLFPSSESMLTRKRRARSLSACASRREWLSLFDGKVPNGGRSRAGMMSERLGCNGGLPPPLTLAYNTPCQHRALPSLQKQPCVERISHASSATLLLSLPGPVAALRFKRELITGICNISMSACSLCWPRVILYVYYVMTRE